MAIDGLTAAEVIALLELRIHPEGGHYREIYRDEPSDGGRGACTSIYYLLAAGEESAWHRIDAVEIWHWYAGGPLDLSIALPDEASVTVRLGNALALGQRPQAVVIAGAWQSARPAGAWSLLGCTVSPAFQFRGFEMAPPGWQPPG
ncbi:cupin domain-containing protein [Telmatospirillum siberiense]|nr:cupin domain-containing protein [Telmatospirillum siberiense]